MRKTKPNNNNNNKKTPTKKKHQKTFEQAHICCQKSVSGALTHSPTHPFTDHPQPQLSKNCYYNNFIAEKFCISSCISILCMATTARVDMQMLHVRAEGKQAGAGTGTGHRLHDTLGRAIVAGRSAG